MAAAAAAQADAPRSFSVTPSHGSASTGVTASFTFTVSAGDPCQGQSIDFTWDGSPWASVAKPTYIAGNGRCTASITQPAPACFAASGTHALAANGSLGKDSGGSTFTIDPGAGNPPCPSATPTPAPTPTPPHATSSPGSTPSGGAQPTAGPPTPTASASISASPSPGGSAAASPAANPGSTPSPAATSSQPCPSPPDRCTAPAAVSTPVHPPSGPAPRAAVFGATAALLVFGGSRLVLTARRLRRRGALTLSAS